LLTRSKKAFAEEQKVAQEKNRRIVEQYNGLSDAVKQYAKTDENIQNLIKMRLDIDKRIANQEKIVKEKGVLMIPAFSLERTQRILYQINDLVENGKIPKNAVIEISVKIEDLPLKSHAEVKILCDYCKKKIWKKFTSSIF
jgi:predicted metal-dependent RNase